MSESDLYPAIIGAYSRGPTRILRQQSALSWQGTVLERTARRLVLADPRPIRAGVPGLADLGGFTSVVITEEHLGATLAVYLAIEVKAGRARPTPEQAMFLAMVDQHGGRAGVARSVEEAGLIIRGE